MKLLVTGGNGFIGSALVRQVGRQTDWSVVNVDNLSLGSSLASVALADRRGGYVHEQADIREGAALRAIFDRHRPDAVIHLAAETHVDRSIDGPAPFVSTNIGGTHEMLEAARAYLAGTADDVRERFRFLHVSTDEVFGTLGRDDDAFTENSPYRPSSPYAASKAAADHLARAWHRTFGLPVIVANCSNNYGPFQFPEKLIPVLILSALSGQPLPIYGNGENVRDWLYVEDHVAGLLAALARGRPGESYNFGGGTERRNIDVARAVCDLLDEVAPRERPHADLIQFVDDRPGHDLRYAIDASKAGAALAWRPAVRFEDGLRRTVAWYLANQAWCAAMKPAARFGTRQGLTR